MVDRDNVGILDTAIRSILACLFLAVAVEQVLPDSMSVVLLILGAGLWLTSATGTCFIYKMLGIDTYHAK